MKWPADRIAHSSPKSFGMYEKSIPLMKEGIDVIHLEVGRPSFDTPDHIKEATKRALDDGKVHYGDFAGEAPLRAAIADRLAARNALDFTPDEIIVTNGLTHASYAVLMAALDEGDEVILLEPYYPQHVNKIELAGGKVVFASLDRENNYRIDKKAIEEKITSRTRMICIVNPANPTGRVYTRNELEDLADVAIKNDLLVLSDEVYEQILYDGHTHISVASLPGMRERTFSLFAYTKAYAMDGWRIGYLAASARFIPALLKMTMNDVAHVNVFIQDGALAALEGPQSAVADMVAEDDRRRKMVCERLNQMSGVTCELPEGTIYAFPDISATGMTSQALADKLLDEAHVVVEAGTFYGPAGEGRLRICFGAEPYERIEEGLQRMADVIARLGEPAAAS